MGTHWGLFVVQGKPEDHTSNTTVKFYDCKSINLLNTGDCLSESNCQDVLLNSMCGYILICKIDEANVTGIIDALMESENSFFFGYISAVSETWAALKLEKLEQKGYLKHLDCKPLNTMNLFDDANEYVKNLRKQKLTGMVPAVVYKPQ